MHSRGASTHRGLYSMWHAVSAVECRELACYSPSHPRTRDEGIAAAEFAGLWSRLFATRGQGAWPQFALAAHYVHYVNRLTVPPIEYAARRFHYLTVATTA